MFCRPASGADFIIKELGRAWEACIFLFSQASPLNLAAQGRGDGLRDYSVF